MLPDERRQGILRILEQSERGTASVPALAAAFAVSEMTIRRDLDWLQSRSWVKRVHGGALLAQAAFGDAPFDQRVDRAEPEKQSIGWAASQWVNDGERIILDAGTTTHQIVQHLGTRQSLTVITTAMPIAQDLARFPQITTIVLGGLLKHGELCTVGPLVTRELARLSADKVFLSAAGYDLSRGLTDPDIGEAEVKEAMIRAATQVILVADSSKWGQASLAHIAPLSVVDVLITDHHLPDEAVAAIESQGIRVVRAMLPGTPL